MTESTRPGALVIERGAELTERRAVQTLDGHRRGGGEQGPPLLGGEEWRLDPIAVVGWVVVDEDPEAVAASVVRSRPSRWRRPATPVRVASYPGSSLDPPKDPAGSPADSAASFRIRSAGVSARSTLPSSAAWRSVFRITPT